MGIGQSFLNIVYQSLFDKALIKQGGLAVKNVQRIKKEDIPYTVNAIKNLLIKPFFPELNLNIDLFLLGSTGKKQSSGDIDIGIDATKISGTTILEKVKKLFAFIYSTHLTSEIKINQITLDMIHLGFPIYNKHGKTNELVQVDILLTDYPEFTKFYMYSPKQLESKYKGAHRNDLLRAILNAISYEVLQVLDNQVVSWKQYDLAQDGLYYQTKTLVDPDGNKLKYKDTDEDLIPLYAKVLDSKTISHDVQTVIAFLFGEGFTQQDIDTFQKTFRIILNNKKFRYRNKRYQILAKAGIGFLDNTKLVFPKELYKYTPKQIEI